MNLKDILVISGMPGMFKFVSQGRHGIIVENLATQKRFNVPVSAKVSGLEDIAIFTDGEDLPLKEVFRKIYTQENGGPSIPHKSQDLVIKDYFANVMPEYDRGRVYVSDMRKIIQWYNALQSMGMIDLEEPDEASDQAPAGTEQPAAE